MLGLQKGEKKGNGWHSEIGILKRLLSGGPCVMLSLRSGQTLNIPITGKSNVLEAPNFSLETLSQERNSCGQGLALEERVG